jgi:hypothetical protein
MSLVYKTLFEVKLMHEFYLTDNNGKTIFALPTQEARLNYLLKEFDQGRQSITKDLQFQFPKSLAPLYSSREIKLIPAYSGIKIALRVNPKLLPDNSLVYEPASKLPADIFIKITKNNTAFSSYTQARIRDSISAGYLFSNNNINGPRTFPFLTNSVADFDASARYEQGELASFGPNDVREFFVDASTPKWNEIKGNAFANPNDLLLLPRKFNYSLEAAGINTASFTLKDPQGNVVKTIDVNNSTLRKVQLDFPEVPEISPGKPAFANGLHTLEVSDSSGFSQRRQFVFSDELFDAADVGVIHISTAPTDAAFNILASDGYLLKRRNPLGIWSNAPVFEILFKGRSAFWKYKNNKGAPITFNPSLTGYLAPEDGFLISLMPLPVSKYHFLLHQQGSTNTKFVPNPTDYNLVKDSRGRLCFEILVPDSALFP